MAEMADKFKFFSIERKPKLEEIILKKFKTNYGYKNLLDPEN